MDEKFLKFPEGFFWGSATSSHQVEGGNVNDWSRWETSEKRIAALEGEGRDPRDFISGKACDSFNRYREDFDIAKTLNHNMFRFSIEWSRIEPEEGKFDHNAMQYYIDIVKSIRERGMEPMVTLWHFTNPVWLSVKGGCENPDFPERYKRFIRYVVDNLKDQVRLWITFNEALTVYSGLAYLKGIWPPEKRRDIRAWRTVQRNITKAHTLAYHEIRNHYRAWLDVPQDRGQWVTSHNISSATSEISQKMPILGNVDGGTSPNIGAATPGAAHNSPQGQVMVGIVENNSDIIGGRLARVLKLDELAWNLYYGSAWRKLIPYCDFIGLNYYTIRRLPGSFRALPKQDTSDFKGWEIYPKGLYNVLMRLKKYNKPIFITENGIDDAADAKRLPFIREHLRWIWQAIQDGADVKGYLYWSLLDNFEWAEGFRPRFGLVAMDYVTQNRAIRPSALEYAKIIAENGLHITTDN